MWKTALKLAVFMFLRSKISHVKDDIGNNLGTVKENMALLAESRALLFKQNFQKELSRIGNSLLGFLFMLLAGVFSTLTGLVWLFAVALNSPNRNIILSIMLILPILIAVGIYFYIRDAWRKEPLFDKTMTQIQTDWILFRTGLHDIEQEIENPNH